MIGWGKAIKGSRDQSDQVPEIMPRVEGSVTTNTSVVHPPNTLFVGRLSLLKVSYLSLYGVIYDWALFGVVKWLDLEVDGMDACCWELDDDLADVRLLDTWQWPRQKRAKARLPPNVRFSKVYLEDL